jgi:hypothetical protein
MVLRINTPLRKLGAKAKPRPQAGAGLGTYPSAASIVASHDTIPNFALNADILSVASGNWTSGSTWDLGRAPQAGEIVGIRTTHTVTYDADAVTEYEAVGVAGALAFVNNADTQLWTQHLLVYDTGHLQIGTVAAPINAANTAEVVFTNVAIDTGTLDSPGTDASEIGNGMHVFGRIQVCGASKTAFLRLGAEPQSGHTALTLSEAATNWADGDLLVLPDTRQLSSGGNEVFGGYVPQWETRTISSSSGTTVNLSSALSNNHWGGEHNYQGGEGTGASAFYPHVGNLTRNVIFRSESGAGVRGHTMYHGAAHVDIRYARFLEMGRTTNGSLSSRMNVSGSSIFSISNASPIVVTLSGVNAMVINGEQVKIAGAAGNTAANGTWAVTGIDLISFSLDGSTGNGSYSGGATITHAPTNQIGRYATHFHHLMGPVGGLGYDATVDPNEFKPSDPANTEGCNGASYRLIGCVIDDPSPAPPTSTVPASKWGITVHDSHYGLIKGNIVHHYAGSGLMTEDGSESFNMIEGNFICNSLGDVDQRALDGRSGVGFTFRGFSNYVRNNVAAGCAGKFQGIVNGSGYYYATGEGAQSRPAATVRVPLFQGADVPEGVEDVDYEVVLVQNQPIIEFSDNEAYGAITTGLSIWHLGSGGAGVSPAMPLSTISNLTVWHMWEEAWFGYPTNNLTFDGFTVRGDPAVVFDGSGDVITANVNHGWSYGDYRIEGGSVLRNADIRGVAYGVNGNHNVHGTLTIEDSHIAAGSSGIRIVPHATPGTGDDGADHETIIDNVTFTQFRSDPGYFHINKDYGTYASATSRVNLRVKDEVTVIDFNGTPGDNFSLFYAEQASDEVMPISTGSGGSPSFLTACPEAGLTNAQAYVAYNQDGTAKVGGALSDPTGCCIGGVIAPAGATTRAGINGLMDES